jgi:hypothetical protein
MRVLFALTLGFTLTGCALSFYDAPEKPKKLTDETSQQEWCQQARHLFSNPYLDADAKQMGLEEMRSRGCPTPPVPRS